MEILVSHSCSCVSRVPWADQRSVLPYPATRALNTVASVLNRDNMSEWIFGVRNGNIAFAKMLSVM